MTQVILEDFLAFNKAIDEEIAKGLTEDEAIAKVGESWDFSKVANEFPPIL